MDAPGTHGDERDEDDEGEEDVGGAEHVPVQRLGEVDVRRGEFEEVGQGLRGERVVDLLVHGEELYVCNCGLTEEWGEVRVGGYVRRRGACSTSRL